MSRIISTLEERLQRLAELREADKAEVENRKNKEFTQVYELGWQRIDQLIEKYPLAARIYSFLAKICDRQAGVVTTQEVLATELRVSVRSIQRATKFLDDEDVIPRLKVGGNVYLYCLNPEEIWKSWDSSKEYAPFKTITLIDRKLNNQVLRRFAAIYKI